MRPRLVDRLPQSNRLRLRVVAGLVAVALVAVAGVAAVSYVLAADAERDAARQAVLVETAVIGRVVAEGSSEMLDLDRALASATDVDGAVLADDGAVLASTGGLGDDHGTVPAEGVAVPARVDGRPVLLTAAPLADDRTLLLAFDQRDTRRSLASLRRSVLLAVVLVGGSLVVGMGVLTRRILAPVEQTARAARRLAQGALGTRVGDQGSETFADLTGAFDEMAAALEQTVEGLRRMQEGQRRFVADVAHELRTPLQALSTAADLLEPAVSQLDGSAQRGAEALVDEVHRLRRLVEDLLEISRLDAGQAAVVAEPVELAPMVRGLLGHRGWGDRVDVLVPVGLAVRTDRRRLDAILANLVGNALTHGEPPVCVHAAAEGDDVLVEVVDAGPGIPVADRERVFERFAKADPARTREGGSGLGLAIAGDSARLLGVRLTLTCPVDGGCVFGLRLPSVAIEPDG